MAYIPRGPRRRGLHRAGGRSIVMHPTAVLGGPGEIDAQRGRGEAGRRLAARHREAQGRSPALAAALVDPRVTVYRYTRVRDGLIDYFTPAEMADQARRRRLAARGRDRPPRPAARVDRRRGRAIRRRTPRGARFRRVQDAVRTGRGSGAGRAKLGPRADRRPEFAGRELAAVVDRRGGTLCRVAKPGHRHGRIDLGAVFLVVFLDRVFGGDGRLAGGAVCLWPAWCACCSRYLCCQAWEFSGWPADCW